MLLREKQAGRQYVKLLKFKGDGRNVKINQFRQYRRNKGRKLLLQSEIDKLILSGIELDDPEIRWRKKDVIELCQELKAVRDFLDNADPYIATMLRMHYVEGVRWRDIAQRQGGGNTQESVRMMCHRYILKG